MNFSHCDHNEEHLTLHDCIATQAYFENGKLGFEFENGFWISPDHPESHLTKMVRTDFAKVEYTLTERGHSLMKVLDQLCTWGAENRPVK